MENQFDDPKSDFISQLTGYLRVGADFTLAAAALGIPEQQASHWLEKANQANEEQKQGIFLDLYEAIRCSHAHAEVIALQRLSAEGGASGAKWILEKLNPEKYGQGQKSVKKDTGKKASNEEQKSTGREFVVSDNMGLPDLGGPDMSQL
jgi:hypothetical protein